MAGSHFTIINPVMNTNDLRTYQKSFDLMDPVFQTTLKSFVLISATIAALAISGISDEKLLGKKAILMPKIAFF
jgi:hypothetical protein